MISQIISAILLLIPLIIMMIPSILYWSKFKKLDKSGKKTEYNNKFLYLIGASVLFMWIFWIGGIIFLFLNQFFNIFGFLTFSIYYEEILQIIGFFIFYIGAIAYNLIIIINGKELLPSTSGLSKDHRLTQKGPYRIIRHPLYISYILILVGLSLILLIYWLLIPVTCMIIGIYPTAKAEEETLIQQFGEEYIEYKRKVGMFFPKFRKSRSLK